MNTSNTAFTFALAAIVGLTPFASDMYLASLPEISVTFASPIWVTQLTLTGYLLILGLGQLFAGPITDAYGRRRPLLIGLAIFTIGSLIAVTAPTMTVLVVARVLQGMGGSLALVVANSSVRDFARGDQATRLYASLMTVSAVAPVVSPAVGGFIDTHFGWRAVFIALTVLGGLVSVLAAAILSETLPVSQRQPIQGRQILRDYGRLLRVRGFIRPLAALTALFVVLFGYIGGASYVYRDEYHLDATQFGLVFGGTGISVVLGAIAANLLTHRIGSNRIALVGVIFSLAGSLLAFVAVLTDVPLFVIATGMGVSLFGLGLCEPALMGMSMSAISEGLGSASAVVGACQFLFGAAATMLIGAVAAKSGLAWAGSLSVAALIAVIIIIAVPARMSAFAEEPQELITTERSQQ